LYTKQEAICISYRRELDFVNKTNSLMPYWKTLLVYSETGTEHTNILCVCTYRRVIPVEPDSTYRNLWDTNG